MIINLPFVIYLLIQFTPRHPTATSLISICVLRTAANSVFTLVHLHAYTLTVTLASKFPVTPTLVALNGLLSSRRHFLAKCLGLVYCTSCRHCTVTNIGETRCTRRQQFGEHFWSIKKNMPGFPVADHFNTAGHSIPEALVHRLTCILCKENAQQKRLEMRLIFQLGTSHSHCLYSDFCFL